MHPRTHVRAHAAVPWYGRPACIACCATHCSDAGCGPDLATANNRGADDATSHHARHSASSGGCARHCSTSALEEHRRGEHTSSASSLGLLEGGSVSRSGWGGVAGGAAWGGAVMYYTGRGKGPVVWQMQRKHLCQQCEQRLTGQGRGKHGRATRRRRQMSSGGQGQGGRSVQGRQDRCSQVVAAEAIRIGRTSTRARRESDAEIQPC